MVYDVGVFCYPSSVTSTDMLIPPREQNGPSRAAVTKTPSKVFYVEFTLHGFVQHGQLLSP